MLGSSLMWLLAVWGVITATFIVVMVWKSLIGLREADVVILDSLEDRQAEEQKRVIARMVALTSWAKGLGAASLALLLLTGGLWAYWSLTTR